MSNQHQLREGEEIPASPFFFDLQMGNKMESRLCYWWVVHSQLHARATTIYIFKNEFGLIMEHASVNVDYTLMGLAN
jgi:hypothetical protein